jgi:hypothetical protein
MKNEFGALITLFFTLILGCFLVFGMTSCAEKDSALKFSIKREEQLKKEMRLAEWKATEERLNKIDIFTESLVQELEFTGANNPEGIKQKLNVIRNEIGIEKQHINAQKENNK